MLNNKVAHQKQGEKLYDIIAMIYDQRLTRRYY
jgi:hypothetical protein